MHTAEPVAVEDATRGAIRRRLGRGLNALLGGAADSKPAVAPPPDAEKTSLDIVIDAIERNPFQPRHEIAHDSLGELADSIRQHGLLQPLLVRPHNGRYQLIAGERRWLAARQAGLEHVPCRVLELDDQRVCEAAIEENVKRQDLGVLEKAQAFKDYLDRFGGSIEDLAGRLSMNRSTLSNNLRLLELSPPVKKALAAGRITGGHARALLALDETDQLALCRRIEHESLSVRQTEQAVRELQQPAGTTADCRPGDRESPATVPFPAEHERKNPAPTAHVLSLQEQLRSILGTKVEIAVRGKESGRIIIPFNSNQEFERILRFLRPAA